MMQLHDFQFSVTPNKPDCVGFPEQLIGSHVGPPFAGLHTSETALKMEEWGWKPSSTLAHWANRHHLILLLWRIWFTWSPQISIAMDLTTRSGLWLGILKASHCPPSFFLQAWRIHHTCKAKQYTLKLCLDQFFLVNGYSSMVNFCCSFTEELLMTYSPLLVGTYRQW